MPVQSARPRGRPRKNLPPVSPEEAIRQALERGEEIHTTERDGQTVYQRPVSLDTPIEKPAPRPGARVRVYNRYPSAIFTSEGEIPPLQEAMVLESDLEHPFLRANLLVLK